MSTIIGLVSTFRLPLQSLSECRYFGSNLMKCRYFWSKLIHFYKKITPKLCLMIY